MRGYKPVDITEKQLEEMVRQAPAHIEEGLRYVDHQKKTDRGPLDVLFADSGNALVVAELKVIEDDGMLVQGIDYYDYITAHIEGFARAFKGKKIDPSQEPRLFLVAPSFSVSLLNRCKWVDISISLFTFQSIALEDNPKEVLPVFSEVTIPSRRESVKVYTMEQRLGYVTDRKVRTTVEQFLKEIQGWDKNRITIEPTKYDISLKRSGKLFAYLGPRRKHFIVYTTDSENKWSGFPIKDAEDLQQVKLVLKGNCDKLE